MAFSPDGALVAAVGLDQRVVLVDGRAAPGASCASSACSRAPRPGVRRAVLPRRAPAHRVVRPDRGVLGRGRRHAPRAPGRPRGSSPGRRSPRRRARAHRLGGRQRPPLGPRPRPRPPRRLRHPPRRRALALPPGRPRRVRRAPRPAAPTAPTAPPSAPPGAPAQVAEVRQAAPVAIERDPSRARLDARRSRPPRRRRRRWLPRRARRVGLGSSLPPAAPWRPPPVEPPAALAAAFAGSGGDGATQRADDPARRPPSAYGRREGHFERSVARRQPASGPRRRRSSNRAASRRRCRCSTTSASRSRPPGGSSRRGRRQCWEFRAGVDGAHGGAARARAALQRIEAVLGRLRLGGARVGGGVRRRAAAAAAGVSAWPVAPAPHRLSVEADGYAGVQRGFSVAPGGRGKWCACRSPAARSRPSRCGHAPPGAVVTVDAERVSSGEVLEVVPGRHRLRVEGAGPSHRVGRAHPPRGRAPRATLDPPRNLVDSPVFWGVATPVPVGLAAGAVVMLAR